MFGTCCYATDQVEAKSNEVIVDTDKDANIPSMNLEELILMMQSRQAKVNIIKKNNIEIENLKEELKNNIILAMEKINNLRVDMSSDKVIVTDETIEELRELLQFLQDSKKTLETDVEKITAEIEAILDVISAKGMQLEQYDKLIEKQNEVIVSMKKLLQTVNKI